MKAREGHKFSHQTQGNTNNENEVSKGEEDTV